MDQPFPVFVAAGEALTDMIADAAAPGRWTSLTGGATWNVARVMASLGVPSAFAGAISTDVFGDALWEASSAAGLDLRFLQRYAKPPLLAMVYETDPPRYFFIGADSADLQFDAARLPAGWSAAARWAHFGGISLAREPLAGKLVALAQALKAEGVRISFDPNFRQLMDATFDATLRRMTELADVIKVSEEDLEGLFRTTDVEQAFATLRTWNPNAVYLYTKGAAGASLHVGAREWSMAAPRIEVVDTVGAGDASIASLVFSMMREPDADPGKHLRFAVAGGAVACLGPGASPPTPGAIEALLKTMRKD